MSSNTIRLAGMTRQNTKPHGIAWVALCIALAVHVMDEAVTDFLSVYNPAVLAIRRQLPFLPLPTFSFDVWLTALIVAVVMLLSLSPFALRGANLMVPLSYLFGLLMFVNGLGHLAGSLYMQRPMPGVYSSPLLLGCSVYLLSTVRNRQREVKL